MRIVGTPFVDRATRRNGSSDLLLLPLLFLGRENAPETNDHWRHCLRVGMWDRVAINSVGFDGLDGDLEEGLFSREFEVYYIYVCVCVIEFEVH